MEVLLPKVDLSKVPVGWGSDATVKRLWAQYHGSGPVIANLTMDDEMDQKNEGVLSIVKVKNWQTIGARMAENDKLRWVLKHVHEKLMIELDELDANDSTHKVTYHFREWYKNAFYFPSDHKKLIKDEQWFEERAGETQVEFGLRIKEQTMEYRQHFGNSAGHNCGGCARNEPCDICGECYPLTYFSSTNSKGKYVTRASNGREYNRWPMRCANKLSQSIGLHTCNACGVRYMLFRKRQVELARKRRQNAHKSALSKLKYQQNMYAFPKFTPCGGRWSGIPLRLVTTQNNIPLEHLPQTSADCPITVCVIREDSKEMLASYVPGSNVYGTKKSNGCSKANRKRLRYELEKKQALMSESKAMKDKGKSNKYNKLMLESHKRAKRMEVSRQRTQFEHDFEKRLDELEAAERECFK